MNKPTIEQKWRQQIEQVKTAAGNLETRLRKKPGS
jgi:hypothetical protein